MWFKNLHIHRLIKPFELTPEELHQKLDEHTFRPCSNLETFTFGWVPPLGRHGTQLTHATNGYIMVCARKEEKVLPAAVVNEIVAEKVADIEESQARSVRNKERKEIREEVLQDLMPRAFSRSNYTFAYIDPHNGWLIIDAANATKAEDLISLLRKAIGQFPTQTPKVNGNPTDILTRWLSQHTPATHFVIEDQCELRDPDKEGGVIRCTRQDLIAEEVQSHLQAGKQVTKIAIEWNERLSAILVDDLTIKRLRFLDVIQEEAENSYGDDAASCFDADFSLMTLELSRFIPALIEAFGGLSNEKSTQPNG